MADAPMLQGLGSCSSRSLPHSVAARALQPTSHCPPSSSMLLPLLWKMRKTALGMGMCECERDVNRLCTKLLNASEVEEEAKRCGANVYNKLADWPLLHRAL